MLILKGNFLFSRLTTGLASVLLAWCALAAPTAAPAAPRPPDAVAVEFYGWYLETLAADQDPLSDRHERFVTYVARDLAAQLLARLQDAGAAKGGAMPDGDYFLQAAHYDGNWLRRQVHAVTVHRRSQGRERVADVIVTLGAGGEPVRTLALAMVLEGGSWKIRHVNPRREQGAESSPEHPVI
jgi:hypothetical protein